MSPDILIGLAVNLIALGAVYGGIKAEVRNLAAGVMEAKQIGERAHARMDSFIEQRSQQR